MVEDLLGWMAWPAALFLAVVAVCITVATVNNDNHKNDVRVACVKAGGELGEHNGWPTCTHPAPR